MALFLNVATALSSVVTRISVSSTSNGIVLFINSLGNNISKLFLFSLTSVGILANGKSSNVFTCMLSQIDFSSCDITFQALPMIRHLYSDGIYNSNVLLHLIFRKKSHGSNFCNLSCIACFAYSFIEDLLSAHAVISSVMGTTTICSQNV
ncbi:MAG: hypothetical protein WCG25_08060 [bacterium]